MRILQGRLRLDRGLELLRPQGLTHTYLYVRHTKQRINRWVAQVPLNLGIVCVHEVLNNLKRAVFELSCFLRSNLSDFSD
jgi:hypothetical protein